MEAMRMRENDSVMSTIMRALGSLDPISRLLSSWSSKSYDKGASFSLAGMISN